MKKIKIIIKKIKTKKIKKVKIKTIGVSEFGFDYNKEYKLWSYVTDGKLYKEKLKIFNNKKESKIIKKFKQIWKKETFNITTGREWICYIKDRYKNCTADQLKEYVRYLNINRFYKNHEAKIFKDFMLIILTAFVTSVFDKVVFEFIGLDLLKMQSTVSFIILHIAFILIIALNICIVRRIMLDTNRDAIRDYFIESYIKVIEELISEKEAKDKMREMPWV